MVGWWWERLDRLSRTFGALGRLGGSSLAASLLTLLFLESCLAQSTRLVAWPRTNLDEAPGLNRMVRRRGGSEGADVARFFALAAWTDVELDLLALSERLRALTLEIRHVHEHVVAAVARDETETPVPIEVLHFALHNYQLA